MFRSNQRKTPPAASKKAPMATMGQYRHAVCTLKYFMRPIPVPHLVWLVKVSLGRITITRGCVWPATGHRGRGSNPSSGPRRLMSTPVAVHLLPWEKVGNIAGRSRARRSISLSRGRGCLAAGAFTFSPPTWWVFEPQVSWYDRGRGAADLRNQSDLKSQDLRF
jgi:hypothetical protein